MRKTTLVSACLASLLGAAAAHADGPPKPKTHYPRSAFLVTVAQKATLQKALDEHTSIRLEVDGNYSGAALVVKSGQSIYGVDSILPDVTIEPGSSGIVLSNVMSHVTFPPSDKITHSNLFIEMQGEIEVKGAVLERNTVLGLEGGIIRVDTSTGGRLVNNRFIRVRSQGGPPLLVMKGDAAHSSYNNVFLWANHLTQPDGMVDVSAQKDLTLVGWDDEAYAASPADPIYRFKGVDALRLWGLHGGTSTKSQPIADIDATEAHLVGVDMGGGDPAKRIVLSSKVERAFLFSSMEEIVDANPGGFRLQGAQMGSDYGAKLSSQGTPVSGLLTPALQGTLTGMFAPTRVGTPWERPELDPVADPAGPDWAKDLASKPDSSAKIQAMIDSKGGAILEPGTYYLSSPLKIREGSKLIGAGADKTVLIAKDPNMDLIVRADASEHYYHWQIADLTLQGGANGVHLKGTKEVGSQYAVFLVSHVTFRGFSNAGFFIDQIFGLDNGLFSDVSFVGCGTGFKQYADPAADPGGQNSGYMDKVTFYRNQFLSNGQAVRLDASRADNLNMFVDSRFENNEKGAFYGQSQNGTMFANCDFVNNGGRPSVFGAAAIISCDFRADANGDALLGGTLQIEGSHFSRGSSTKAVLFDNLPAPWMAPNGGWANYSADFMLNSTADDIPLGNITFGLFLNNKLPSRPDLSKPAVFVRTASKDFKSDGTTITTLAEGTTKPVPSLLFGASYATAGGSAGTGGTSGTAGASGSNAGVAGAGGKPAGSAGTGGTGAGTAGSSGSPTGTAGASGNPAGVAGSAGTSNGTGASAGNGAGGKATGGSAGRAGAATAGAAGASNKPADAASSDDGCSCTLAPSDERPGANAYWALLASLVALVARRRVVSARA